MDTKSFQPGQTIGIARRGRIVTARLASIERVTPSGQVIIDGLRFKPNGREMSDLHEHYLIPVEEAEKLIEAQQQREAKQQQQHEAYLKTPEGISTEVVRTFFADLRARGIGGDVNGEFDGLECEVQALLEDYLKRYPSEPNE